LRAHPFPERVGEKAAETGVFSLFSPLFFRGEKGAGGMREVLRPFRFIKLSDIAL
jgi:hypothetical protein